jgi:hypothetical protein
MYLVSLWLTTIATRQMGWLAGALAVIKTNYLVLLASLWKKQRRGVLIAGLTIIGLVVLSLLVFSPQVYSQYWQERGQGLLFSSAQSTGTDYYNQSLRATLARWQWPTVYPITFVIMAVAAIVYLVRSGDRESGVVLSLLLSPIIWQHYIPVVYPVVLILGWRIWHVPGQSVIKWAWLATAGLLMIHLPQLHWLPAGFLIGLLASHFFLGLVLLLAVIWMQKKFSLKKTVIE